MTKIYSGLRGYIMFNELGGTEIFLVDSNGSFREPNLYLPNLLAIEKLRDYLNGILDKVNEGIVIRIEKSDGTTKKD